jgi:hypothetical protein
LYIPRKHRAGQGIDRRVRILNQRRRHDELRLVEKPVDGGFKVPMVMWEEIVDVTADKAVAATMPSKNKDQSGPVLFLQDILLNGPVLAATIEERGAARGFSVDQLKRAKARHCNIQGSQARWPVVLGAASTCPQARCGVSCGGPNHI